MDGMTLFLGHFGMGRFCTWAVFVWAVFACGPFWDGPFSFGMTWYLGRLHLKAIWVICVTGAIHEKKLLSFVNLKTKAVNQTVYFWH